MTDRILVAGVGNIFLGDDGFGCEVARRLAAESLPAGVRVVDFGIRSVHLAFEIRDGYDALILVDAVGGDDLPGTIRVFDRSAEPQDWGARGLGDAHGFDPESALAALGELGDLPRRVYLVGCTVGDVAERIGLCEPVAVAVDTARREVRTLIDELRSGAARLDTGPRPAEPGLQEER